MHPRVPIFFTQIIELLSVGGFAAGAWAKRGGLDLRFHGRCHGEAFQAVHSGCDAVLARPWIR
jgi:hypothetical protein